MDRTLFSTSSKATVAEAEEYSHDANLFFCEEWKTGSWVKHYRIISTLRGNRIEERFEFSLDGCFQSLFYFSKSYFEEDDDEGKGFKPSMVTNPRINRLNITSTSSYYDLPMRERGLALFEGRDKVDAIVENKWGVENYGEKYLGWALDCGIYLNTILDCSPLLLEKRYIYSYTSTQEFKKRVLLTKLTSSEKEFEELSRFPVSYLEALTA